MKDIDNNLTEEEANIINQGKLCKATFNKLFYADDTLIMTTTTEAAELILHKIQKESALYNLKLNQSKCCLFRMSAIQTIQYADGHTVLIVNQATYLGTTITANGNYHAEISARIAASLTTLKRLDIFWNKTPLSKKWKLRVYDAVITTKLLYGLASASLSNTDKKRLDAFQNKGLRKILGIKHAYFSRIRNQQVIATANQEAKPKKHKEIIKMFKKLERQITLFAHLFRAPEDDEMKKIAVQPNGKRVWAGFRRVGKPKLKWYEVVRSATIDKLNLNILPANWKNQMSEIEMLQMIIDTAHDRESNIL